MKNLIISSIILLLSSFTHATELNCYTKEERMKSLKICVERFAKGCDEDWKNAIPSGGRCLDFTLYYHKVKRYEAMAMIAHKRALLLPNYNGGGAYMSYFPDVGGEFFDKSTDAYYKNLDDMNAKSITKSEYEKYVCGETKKGCKNKISVFESLNYGIFRDTFHPYYRTHPGTEFLTKELKKILMEKHIKKHIKKSDLKYVEMLKKEGKITR